LGTADGMSRNAVWRRIKALEDQVVITGRVALVNPKKLGLGLLVFIQIKTAQHSVD
jgi:Lrp/AsnC family transcriptional regulator